MQVRCSVKCVAVGHERENQAGVVIATDGQDVPESVVVRWDVDLVDEQVAVADLRSLTQN